MFTKRMCAVEGPINHTSARHGQEKWIWSQDLLDTFDLFPRSKSDSRDRTFFLARTSRATLAIYYSMSTCWLSHRWDHNGPPFAR